MARFWAGRRQAGLSLIELTVVAAIIAILAALTTVAVTGVATSTRGTTRTSDIEETQKAMETFIGSQAASQYPTNSKCKGGDVPHTVTSICAASAVSTDYNTVDEATYGVDINLDADATDTGLKVTGINWAADVGDGRTFSPSFIVKPKHADATVTDNVLAWVVNSDGKAVVLIPAGEY